MDFSTEHVEKAVHQFYVDASTQQEVNKWLMAAQISPQAWLFSGQLLDREKSPEVQFFGANTLHMKIARFWHELPPTQIEALRSQLFDHVTNFASGPKMVLTRLCVALSALTMHTVPDQWPDAVDNIISTFQNHPKLKHDEKLTVLLEMLTVLPEEFFTAYLANYRKGVVRHELQKAIPQVLAMLQNLLVPESPSLVYEQCLRCFSSWVQFGIPLAEAESIIAQVFKALHSEAFFDTAVETLVHVFAQQHNFRQPNTLRKLLPYVVQQHDLLETAKQNGDIDMCQGLSKLIVTAAACNTRLLLDETLCGEQERQKLALAIVNLVLQCTAIPGYFPVDENCSDLPFYFWYNFQDDIIATEGENNAVLIQVYSPIYMALINILLQKVQFPPMSEYNSWHADEKEYHRCYRQDIADTLMYAYNFLHDPLLCSLTQLFSQILQNPSGGEVKWQEVEAVLFAVTSIAESVDIDEFLYLPTLFRNLSQIPCHNYLVVSQALYMIGAYGEWLSGHPELLGNVIPLLLQGLKDTELAQAATLSLKDVVSENQQHIKPFVTDILTASKESFDNNIVQSKDAIRLMCCLGYVLSVLPLQETMSYLDILLAPHINQLQHAAQQQATAATKALIQQKLHMLCWLFTSLNIHWDAENENKTNFDDPQPVLLVLQKLLPMLPQLLAGWLGERAVIEAVCDTLKRATRTLMEDAAPLVPDAAALVTRMYSMHPSPPPLDLAKQLIILFAHDEKFTSINENLFQSMCEKSLQVIQLSHIQDYTDLVEGLMNFLGHIAKKNSKMYAHPQCNLLGLFEAGIVGVSLPEQPTVKSSCMFLCEFINCSEKHEAVKNVIASHGGVLVERLMRNIGGESPRSVVDPMSEVFLALNKQHFEAHSSWLHALIARQDFPTPHVTHQQKEHFIRRVLKERSNKKRLKECVSEFTLQCRGLMGTQYALQTLLTDPAAAAAAAAAAQAHAQAAQVSAAQAATSATGSAAYVSS